MEIVFFVRTWNYTSNHSKKHPSSAILCCVSGEQVNRIHDWEKFGSRKELHISSNLTHRELFDIAAKPVVFEWRIYPEHTAAQTLQGVQKMMVDENKVHPFHVKERVIFMSMYNDIDFAQRHNEDT